jgi:hypothetical protein
MEILEVNSPDTRSTAFPLDFSVFSPLFSSVLKADFNKQGYDSV